jgi:hypothetical protein
MCESSAKGLGGGCGGVCGRWLNGWETSPGDACAQWLGRVTVSCGRTLHAILKRLGMGAPAAFEPSGCWAQRQDGANACTHHLHGHRIGIGVSVPSA